VNFDWSNPYPTARAPVFARNVVSTSQPLAAQAGLRVLAQGGNAVDAAIAAAAVITMTEPCSNGLGADAFAIVWDGKQLHGLNASGISPAAWTLDYFARKYGADLERKRPTRGADAITVPGAVAGWSVLHGKLGKLPFADVLAPAIDYAERGFAVSPNVQDKWTRAAPILKDQPGWAEHFLPQGRVPAIGEHFRLAGAARTLKAIAASNGEAFYRGEIASAIAAHVRAAGGAMTEDDLAACWRFMHSDGWVGTISTDFAGHTLHEIPPNGQGIAALGALGILRHTNLAETIAALGIDAPETQHLMIEAMKLAFADTYAYVSDARSMRVRPADLLDDAYLRERAKRIDPKRASEVTAGAPPRGGTIYLAAADANGMMVSLIQSNYMGFGSGLVVPGYGVSLQNRGHGFAMDAKSPNVVAPGKRPFHTIIPAFLMKDGRPQMSFGVMGGNMQPQGHVQTLVRLLLGGQQPQAACDAPRWKTMDGLELEVEATLPVATVEALRARGHRIISGNDTYMDFGAGQFIWRLGDPTVDGYVAASDPRRDGLAVGF
jgi:gamma-glutamyltranspeptidase/glutathione hydrolase